MTVPDARRPAWHALLAPLPADARARRQPVAPLEVQASAAGAAIAGWEQVVVELSAGAAGSRIVLAVVDGRGQLLSASDLVIDRTDAPARVRHESVGGRFAPDGTFHGTRWVSSGPEPAGGDPIDWESVATPPGARDGPALRALVEGFL